MAALSSSLLHPRLRPGVDLILLDLELLGLIKALAAMTGASRLRHFDLNPPPPAEVPTMLAACCSSTSSISVKASISWSYSICGRVWVDGGGAVSSPGRERHWITLLGGIIRVGF
jgi:hypothetical protein